MLRGARALTLLFRMFDGRTQALVDPDEQVRARAEQLVDRAFADAG